MGKEDITIRRRYVEAWFHVIFIYEKNIKGLRCRFSLTMSWDTRPRGDLKPVLGRAKTRG
jgi:hypothetical protein